MPSHNKASAESKSLCDKLQLALKIHLPALQSSITDNTCGLFVPGRNRFAFVYHRSDAQEIRVYFRGDPSVYPQDPGGRLKIHVRPKIEKGWDREFPFFIIVNSGVSISSVADILLSFAYPLSEKKKRARNSLNSESITIPEEIPPNQSLPEGAIKQIIVNSYERNETARAICIAHYGAHCTICKFDFEKFYGDRGAGYIHVHHITPLAKIRNTYLVDPITDLRPVCPNCHAMIHRTKNPVTCEAIKIMINKTA